MANNLHLRLEIARYKERKPKQVFFLRDPVTQSISRVVAIARSV